MDVKVLQEDENSIRFMLSGVTPAFANAIRRIIVSEVPTMAIDDVMVVENTSVMYDEILAHRLGLIPLNTDLESYVLPEECECKSELGCNRCRASFTLDVEAQDETVTIYSGQLQPQDPNVKPVNEKIPIVKLAPKQKIRLEAYARLGRGLEHAKWQPVSACAYKYLPYVTINPKRAAEAVECAKWCPKNVFAFEGNKAIVKNEMNCTLCMECVRHCQKKPPIKVGWDDKVFIFYVEPTGSIPVDMIVREASRLLGAKAETLSRLMSAPGEENR